MTDEQLRKHFPAWQSRMLKARDEGIMIPECIENGDVEQCLLLMQSAINRVFHISETSGQLKSELRLRNAEWVALDIPFEEPNNVGDVFHTFRTEGETHKAFAYRAWKVVEIIEEVPAVVITDVDNHYKTTTTARIVVPA